MIATGYKAQPSGMATSTQRVDSTTPVILYVYYDDSLRKRRSYWEIRRKELKEDLSLGKYRDINHIIYAELYRERCALPLPIWWQALMQRRTMSSRRCSRVRPVVRPGTRCMLLPRPPPALRILFCATAAWLGISIIS